MYIIKTLSTVSEKGLQELPPEQYLIDNDSNTPDAIIVRSTNMHQYTLPDAVKVIGRAGAGTNNIPIEQMTQQGIPVLNTPGANANAVKELVLTGMLISCRNIDRALQFSRELNALKDDIKTHVEQHKKQFTGVELPGKTLGIIGLGNIGVEVANTALTLGMKVMGYDPAISVNNAWKLSRDITRVEQINELFQHSDYISLHVPYNDATNQLINHESIMKIKPGAVLLNFARGAIVDNTAIVQAIEAGHIKHYVCDFPSKELLNNPNIICLPHLGATTQEAQENCAVMIINQVKDFLQHGHIKNSVNFPNICMPRAGCLRLAIINQNVPDMVAQISSVISKNKINIINMINKSKDNTAYTLIDLDTHIANNVIDQIKAIDGVIRLRAIDYE